MSATATALSKSRVNRAGDSLRRFGELIRDGKHDELSDALDVLVKWRTSHNTPLRTATMGLRSRVKTEKCEVEVSQRLKRIPTIIDKLYREPGMKLARMADIGGCRAVLDSIDEVRRVEARLCKQRPPKIYHDYIKYPKKSGYRGVHVISEYNDRLVEVQLRTRTMHEWAVMVERITSLVGVDVKSGEGPAEIRDWFQAVSEAMHLEEQGLTVPDILVLRVAQLRTAADPLLRAGRTR